MQTNLFKVGDSVYTISPFDGTKNEGVVLDVWRKEHYGWIYEVDFNDYKKPIQEFFLHALEKVED